MVRIAHALLVLPDGRIVFQRRTKDAKFNPGSLGFFGGHIEQGETPLQAIRRELQEETSLNVRELEITPVSDYPLAKEILKTDDDRMFYLFRAEVPTAQFKDYEGSGAEAYTRKEALARDDLVQSVRYAVEKVVKE